MSELDRCSERWVFRVQPTISPAVRNKGFCRYTYRCRFSYAVRVRLQVSVTACLEPESAELQRIQWLSVEVHHPSACNEARLHPGYPVRRD